MARLFIIAHAPLASAFQALAAHAFPDAASSLTVYDVSAGRSDDVQAAEAAGLLDMGPLADTLVLTDVFGATPCNIARRLAEARGLRVLVGINLPMLWRALNYRERPLDDLVLMAMAGGTQGIMQLSATRPQNQVQKPASHDSNDGQDQQ